jgi:hypothetical protein
LWIPQGKNWLELLEVFFFCYEEAGAIADGAYDEETDRTLHLLVIRVHARKTSMHTEL